MTLKFWEHIEEKDGKIIFTVPEPEKFNKKYKELGFEMRTDSYIEWEIAKRHIDNLNTVNQETRKEILERFKKGGISIKETAEIFNVSSDLVSDIIVINIQSAHFLREVSI